MSAYWQYYIMGIILLPGLIFAIIAQMKVTNAFSTYKKELTRSGISGYQFAKNIIAKRNLNIQINRIDGELTDFYNSKDKSLNLSDASLNSSSVAGVAVAAHELGHALQDAEGYKMLKVRHILIKTSNICSVLLWPLVIIGLICNFVYVGGVVGDVFLWCGVAFFSLSIIVALVTLPVEFDASKRALALLKEENTFDDYELDGAKKVLSAAALTYVASLVVAILNLLRFLAVIFANKKRD